MGNFSILVLPYNIHIVQKGNLEVEFFHASLGRSNMTLHKN